MQQKSERRQRTKRDTSSLWSCRPKNHAKTYGRNECCLSRGIWRSSTRSTVDFSMKSVSDSQEMTDGLPVSARRIWCRAKGKQVSRIDNILSERRYLCR
jgi:hypothetical protein